jgi:hypothetical protein
MNGAPPSSGRITPRQALGWGLFFVLVAALVALYFIFGRSVRPLPGME